MDNDVDDDCSVPSDLDDKLIQEDSVDDDRPPKGHETTLIVFDDGTDVDDAENDGHITSLSDTSMNTSPGKLPPTFLTDYMSFVRFSWDAQEYAILGQTPTTIVNGNTSHQSNDNDIDVDRDNGKALKSYENDVQIVLFHPKATHQTYGHQSFPSLSSSGGPVNQQEQKGHDPDEIEYATAGDYTIRSPYPTIHLLREQDVLAAVRSGYPQLEYLPTRNQAKMNELGVQRCKELLERCRME